MTFVLCFIKGLVKKLVWKGLRLKIYVNVYNLAPKVNFSVFQKTWYITYVSLHPLCYSTIYAELLLGPRYGFPQPSL